MLLLYCCYCCCCETVWHAAAVEDEDEEEEEEVPRLFTIDTYSFIVGKLRCKVSSFKLDLESSSSRSKECESSVFGSSRELSREKEGQQPGHCDRFALY